MKPLTPRQKKVLELSADGHTSKVVAAKLGVGLTAILTSLKGINKKLGTTSKTSAVATAIRKGLIQ